jgi:hypothetical protein
VRADNKASAIATMDFTNSPLKAAQRFVAASGARIAGPLGR